jgi:hypothetical protein
MILLPLHIANIYANKLYLFTCYVIIFFMMEFNIYIGTLLNLLFIFGHTQFLSVVITNRKNIT